MGLRNGILAAGAYEEPADPTTQPNFKTDDGAVYLFRRGAEGWGLTDRVPGPQQPLPLEGESYAHCGIALAITQDALWIGAEFESLVGQPQNAGAVYTYPFTSTGSLATVPVIASAANAELGTNLAASYDGVVAISEPFSAHDDNGQQGVIHILQ